MVWSLQGCGVQEGRKGEAGWWAALRGVEARGGGGGAGWWAALRGAEAVEGGWCADVRGKVRRSR